MIGILGAYALNTWNSNRIELAIERDYVERLNEEIKDDIKYYKNLKEDFEKKRNGLNRITQIWRSNSSTVSDSIPYINYFFHIQLTLK